MSTQVYDHAKEEIRKALVNEYLKKHPDVREQDVVMACIHGELIFTHLAAIMSDIAVRKEYSQGLVQAKNLFAELTVHQDERWNDCITSTRHSKQIVDCLHSSSLQYFNREQWNEEQEFLQSEEGKCAAATVKVHELHKTISKFKTRGKHARSDETRGAFILYLKNIVEQLKSVHTVFGKEVNLGDVLAVKSKNFIEVDFPDVARNATEINMLEISKLYKALDENTKITTDELYQTAKSSLSEIKEVLSASVDTLKSSLEERRDQYEKIWVTISEAENVVATMEQIQEKAKAGELPPLDPDLGKEKSKTRMARFLGKFKK